MKIDPISLIINNNLNIEKNIFLVSGNEITLMEKIKDTLFKRIKQNGSYENEVVKDISFVKNDLGLFNKNKIYLVNSHTGIENSVIDSLANTDDIFIFYFENSIKNKSVKNLFLKSQDCCLFDCYEITKESKIKILQKFLADRKINVGEEIFWKILDKLDNKYMLLEKELEKIEELDVKDIKIKDIEALISKGDEFVERIFFQIFGNNEEIVKIFNNSVINVSDVNNLYYTVKQYSFMLLAHENLSDFEKSIPKYLFREKTILMKIFKKYNSNKKKRLVNLLFETENRLRKNGELSITMGLRFFLIFKKITIS